MPQRSITERSEVLEIYDAYARARGFKTVGRLALVSMRDTMKRSRVLDLYERLIALEIEEDRKS